MVAKGRGKSALTKDIFREILKTKNRFLSIFLIVAIGVGFFAGVTASGPDMKLTADTYFEEQNLSDIRLLSTLGFTSEDVVALTRTEGVQSVEPGHWMDTIVEIDGNSEVVKVMGYDFSRLEEGDQTLMNRPLLIEGRFPQADNECVVDSAQLPSGVHYQVGQTIRLTTGKPDADLSDTLAYDEFTIVGVVQSPIYISLDRGTSDIGSGKVSGFIMVPDNSFLTEYYTEIYLKIQGTQGLSAYSQSYKDRIAAVTAQLEDLGEERADIRLEQVKAEAQEKIDDAQKDLDEGIQTQQKELADAQEKLEDARRKIEDAQVTLSDETVKYHETIADAQKQLDDAKKELDDGEDSYESGLIEYKNGVRDLEKAEEMAAPLIAAAEKQLAETEKALTAGQEQLGAVMALVPSTGELSAAFASPSAAGGIIANLTILSQVDPTQTWASDLASYLQNPAGMTPQQNAVYLAMVGSVQAELSRQEQELQGGWTLLNEGKQKLEAQKKQLSDARKALADAEDTLASARRTLDEGWKQYKEKEAEFLDGKEDGWQQILDGQTKIRDAKAELSDGEAEYATGKAESDAEIADGQEKLATARRDLQDLSEPKWYVFDRGDFPGNQSFGNDADRIAAIARVFPIFFLLVAALVCLTTMTRMVEEQRTQIGTLKALGYRSGAIISKFLIYALTATITGSIAGLVVGMYLFPTIIYNAYGILYSMISVKTPFRFSVAVISTLAAAVTVLMTVLFTCQREMREQPASLMRPKAPKNGKRVLLERVGFIWKRLSFSHKVTLRNLFRYKKRMLMTVVGIAGCTALMLTGFGLYDSIDDIVGIQFGQLYHYQLTTAMKDDLTDEDRKSAEEILFRSPQIEASQYIQQESLEAQAADGKKYDVYLIVSSQPEKLDEFVTLRTRLGHDPISLEEKGVVLTEKVATFLDARVGDTITVLDADHNAHQITVGAITEHYTSNYLYLTPQIYQQYFGKEPSYNMVQSKLSETGLPTEEDLTERLVAENGVLGVSSITSIQKEFKDMIHSLTYVVLVLIVSAGALAFVVLYNLSNINVTERIREIATIKVLGFYDREVSAYIYRENILLTLMGIGAGLLLGIALHQYVVVTAETDIVMFGRVIRWTSYLFAGILTLAFSLMVNIALHFKLKKVSMVESLKSIE